MALQKVFQQLVRILFPELRKHVQENVSKCTPESVLEGALLEENGGEPTLELAVRFEHLRAEVVAKCLQRQTACELTDADARERGSLTKLGQVIAGQTEAHGR